MSDRLRQRWRALHERRRRRRSAGHRLLAALADARPNAFFVEIGAGDGIECDHLWPFVSAQSWRGVMVEPVPYVFKRLERNYSDISGVALENAAISDRDGELPFFFFSERADDSADPEGHYHLLGSLSREVLLRHRHVLDGEQHVAEAQIRCLTFESLCRKHGVAQLDIVIVDAEGHDCEIIGQIDLERRRPRLIAYEDVHVERAEAKACSERLRQAGYELVVEGFDTWCVDLTVDDDLSSTWGRILEAGPSGSRADLERWFSATGENRADG